MCFLDIPVEIREQILDEYLDMDSIEAPVDPASTIHDRETNGHLFFKKIQNPALPVLLISKQLHAEMKGVLHRKSSQRANYSLDIMYVKHSGLWPTWLSAPFLTTNIDTVHATFRMFNRPKDVPDAMIFKNMWRGGDGGPPLGVWVFYNMFITFLHQRIGPWPRHVEEEAGVITVQKLILDILTPGEPDILPLATNRLIRPRDYMNRLTGENGDMSTSAVDIFADFIRREIGGLLSMGYHTTRYGEILHERIGSIEIHINGATNHMWDLSEIFARLPLDDYTFGTWSAAERKASYRSWKLWAAELRRRAGFRMVEEDETRRWWE